MNDVSLAGAFLAGLVSFLSPCVLPLVPGYISMLSGVGMEQLRKGEVPSSSLLGSSLSFIAGFSVVFISFGASASAVGVFLKQNRNALTPIAGALILLFGLHLLGLLIKLNPRIGIIFGVILVALGIASLLRRAPFFAGFGALMASDIRMLRDFGAVTVVDLAVSVVGVLIVLPAALVWAERRGTIVGIYGGLAGLAPSSRPYSPSPPRATKFSAGFSSLPSTPPASPSRFFSPLWASANS